MKSFVITIPEKSQSFTGVNPDHEQSLASAKVCIDSFKKFHPKWPISIFDAVCPPDYQDIMSQYKLRWNYPWLGEELDIATGLKKRAYETANPAARISCALSHWLLWKRCSEEGIPYIILEHDAVFTQAIDNNKIDLVNYDIIGINDPRGATRKSGIYFDKIQVSSRNRPTEGYVIPVPIIDKWDVPQGLAGNSAYIMTQAGANTMLNLVDQYGLWPNDSLMCRQLVGISKIGVTTTHYTQVQRTKSTTTL